MAWLWQTFADFKQRVDPIEATLPSFLEAGHHGTTAERWQAMFDEIHALSDSAAELLRFNHFKPQELTNEQGQAITCAVVGAVLHGERLLGYNRRLVETEAGCEFIDAKHVGRDPDYYLRDGRLVDKALRLGKACEGLLQEWHRQIGLDGLFLTWNLDLPDDLKGDFTVARNLFSTGFDEAGVIYCGRGLEGVVRRIGKNHNVLSTAVERAKFFTILEALEKKRFAADNSVVIEESTKHLLHYSRTIRNQSAHPLPGRGSEPYREQAILMARKAAELWKKCSAPGVKLI